ncbi:hypothetical protein ACI8AG_09510 [Blastococcus sp. SYSU DS0552]
MPKPNPFTVPVTIDVLSYDALCSLATELEFCDPVDLGPGPFVYVLVDPRGGTHYPGKSDAQGAPAGRRAMAYPKWIADYYSELASSGRPDPMVDPGTGDLGLAWWSPIIRYAARYGLTVKAASVDGTDASAPEWEARIKALGGSVAALESIVGGSGWEAKDGTLRGNAYAWAIERLESRRGADPTE